MNPLVRAGAISVLAATAAALPVSLAQAKPSLHQPSLVQTSRAGTGTPGFLVSVAPAGSPTARVAQAQVGCSIFSVSGPCAQQHAIALILYGATTASLEQAATDAYDIAFQVTAGIVHTTEDLYTYVLNDTAIVFRVAQEVEDAAIDKIAAILGLANGATAAPAPAPPAPTPTTPADPTTPVTPAPATPVTPTPVTLAPLPITSANGTVTVLPVAGGAQTAARRPLAVVKVRLGAIGDTALVPVPARATRRLAALKAGHGRVRLVQRLTYRVHVPGDAAPDYRTVQTAARTFALGARSRPAG